MRRNARLACGAALAAVAGAAVLGFACAPFGTESGAPDASGDAGPPDAPDQGTNHDGGGADAGDAGDAANAGTTCTSFGGGGTGGFVLTGNATITAEGVVLSLAKTTASLTKTFETDHGIKRSVVELTFRFTVGSGQWGTGNGDFTDFVAQYYGTTPTYASSATTSLAFANGAVDLDVWSAPNVFAGSTTAFLPLPSAGADLTMTISTTWSADGTVQVVADKLHTKTIATKTGADSQKLTLVVGGESSGTVPNVELLVKRVCLTLQ